MMRKVVLVFLLFLPMITSCANVGRVSSVIDPKDVEKEDLKSLPQVTTPLYKFKVTTVKSLSDKSGKIIREVDSQFTEFSRCMNIRDKGSKARTNLISVVNGTFECKYHGGRCNGEYDSRNELIIVTYRAFNRERTLPLLKHEWAHAYRFLKPDDSNLDELKRCTKY
ncbi:MAG: hypothetical protein HYW01_03470 [Deltaproteobacteria bacterium]|nr:hypothetical protein [Deltaproteobacteria bacterium]